MVHGQVVERASSKIKLGVWIDTLFYDADGLGAGCRGDTRVINEKRRKLGLSEINVEPFRGSGSVYDTDGEMIEKRLNKDFFVNLKAQTWWTLRLRLQETFRVLKGRDYDPDMIISLSSEDIDAKELALLTAELSQPTYTKNGVGKILVSNQPNGTASPNRADSVMICFNPQISELSICGKL